MLDRDAAHRPAAARPRRLGHEASHCTGIDHLTVDPQSDKRIQVEEARTSALVGVDHRAAMRQRPRAGGSQRTVDPARAGHRRHHHARPVRIEAVRHLHHHPVRLPQPDLADPGLHFHTGHRAELAIQPAVAARGGQIGDPAPVVVVGQLPPPRCIRRNGWRLGIGQAFGPQPAGQQIVAAQLLRRHLRRRRRGLLAHRGATSQSQQQQQGQSHGHPSQVLNAGDPTPQRGKRRLSDGACARVGSADGSVPLFGRPRDMLRP